MHIAIRSLLPQAGHTNRGAGVYARNLIEGLQIYEKEHTYQLFDSPEEILQDTDIIHYPYFDPFFLTLPLVSAKPTLVTVHDLIPLVFPERYPSGIRGSIKWIIQRYSLRSKNRIITDSECSKNDIERIAGFSSNKIDVIYLAPSLTPRRIVIREKTCKQYGIQGKYFLYVGDVNWNKNVPGLLRAFLSFAAQHPSFGHLVMTGGALVNTALPETGEIRDLCTKFHIEGKVICTGHVPNDDLIALYKNAEALIQPSFYEGFGFPVLDALSIGCPVVCSFTSSLKEIAGPSIMVDPSNFQSIEVGMQKILSLSGRDRKLLIQKGHLWSKQFTWQQVARLTIRSYEKALGEV